MREYQQQYIKNRALECKQHLEKYAGSVTTVYTEKSELDANKEIFLDILGEQLFKRVTFIPNQI